MIVNFPKVGPVWINPGVGILLIIMVVGLGISTGQWYLPLIIIVMGIAYVAAYVALEKSLADEDNEPILEVEEQELDT